MKNPFKNIKFNNPLQLLYAAIALLVLFFIVSKVLKALQGIGNNTTDKEADKELDKNKLTFSKTEYKGFADQLREAMFDLGTNESTIYNVFRKMKTRDDILALISAFGKRDYYFFGISAGKLTLTEWFGKELSNRDISKLNEVIKERGINYTF